MNFPRRALAAMPDRASLFWILQVGGWGLFGAAMFVAGVSILPLADAVVQKPSLTVFGFLVSLLLREIYRSLARRRVPVLSIAAAAIPLSAGAAAVWMMAHHVVIGAVTAARRSGPPFDWKAFPDFTNTIYYSFVLLAWSVLYFGVHVYLDLLEERERLIRAEGLAHQARLRALRLQLNPHFLFNTLNAVSTLVRDARNEEANRMLLRLSQFLRGTLDRPESDEIPLAQEIDFACQYLDIQEARFGERLRVDISVAPGTESALVPSMILQPLVENAVRHAILPREAGGAISILAARDGSSLTLAVRDDGPGLGPDAESRGGVGLRNTRERLSELYGGGADLRLGASPGGGLEASIRLPFRATAAGAA